MCNLYRLEKAHDATARLAHELGKQLEFPEGVPNFEPRAEIRITDRAPIVRLGERGDAELVQRRWSWPGPGGKPVYNFRSEGREFPSGRCLILADGFYEFTPHTDPSRSASTSGCSRSRASHGSRSPASGAATRQLARRSRC
jgi:putative SOS response-associated peptidase YedK